MKIKSANFFERCMLVLVIIIAYTVSLTSVNVRMILAGLVIAVFIMNLLFVKQRIGFCKEKIFWIATLFIILIQNKGYGGSMSYVVFYMAGLVLLFRCDHDISIDEFAISFISVLGKIFSCITLIQLLMPDVYEFVFEPFIMKNEEMDLDRVAGTYLNGFTNQVAINAVYILFGIMALILTGKRAKRYGNSVWIVLEVVSLLLTGKRMSILFGGFAIFIVLSLRESFTKKVKKIFIYSIAAVCVFFLATFFVPQTRDTLLRFFIKAASINEFSSGRFTLYAYAFDLFKNSPIWGNGWFSYAHSIVNYWGSRIHAHNIYLQLLCEVGIVGAALFCLAMFVSLYYSVKKLKAASDKREIRIYRFATAVQIFYLFYGVTGNPIYDMHNLLLYFLVLSIAFNIGKRRSTD